MARVLSHRSGLWVRRETRFPMKSWPPGRLNCGKQAVAWETPSARVTKIPDWPCDLLVDTRPRCQNRGGVETGREVAAGEGGLLPAHGEPLVSRPLMVSLSNHPTTCHPTRPSIHLPRPALLNNSLTGEARHDHATPRDHHQTLHPPRRPQPRRLRGHPGLVRLGRGREGDRLPPRRRAQPRLRGHRPPRRPRQRRQARDDMGGQERREGDLHLRRHAPGDQQIRQRPRRARRREGHPRLHLHGARARDLLHRLRHAQGRLRHRPPLLRLRPRPRPRPHGGQWREGARHPARPPQEDRRDTPAAP